MDPRMPKRHKNTYPIENIVKIIHIYIHKQVYNFRFYLKQMIWAPKMFKQRALKQRNINIVELTDTFCWNYDTIVTNLWLIKHTKG